MQQFLLIAVGGSLGAVARYGLSTFVYHTTSETFPWGTLVVNLSGSFVIGVVIELFDTAIIPTECEASSPLAFLEHTQHFPPIPLKQSISFGVVS